METNTNILTLTDAYKQVHWMMYPELTTHSHGYLESRCGATFPTTVFFGLQYFLMKYLEGSVVTAVKIDEAEKIAVANQGDKSYFNREMWEHILNVYDGRLPVEISAVAEGTAVPTGNVLMTVLNTDPKCAALTTHLETLLSQVWASCTVATTSYHIRKSLAHYRDITGSQAGIEFGLHDFGFRGTSSVEFAGIGGLAHLTSFVGTDTLHAYTTAKEFYDATYEETGVSVPATEHSVMTALGPRGETEIVKRLIRNFPRGVLSVVIDSFSDIGFIRDVAAPLKEQILGRDGLFVFRPDSGDPVQTTILIFRELERVFGTLQNAKGYKELHPKIRVLWGDGIDHKDVSSILSELRMAGYSANGIVFGMGGGLLQKMTRDTQRFAFKSSAQCRDGVWHDVYKNPANSQKTSKRGLLALVKHQDDYTTVSVPSDLYFGKGVESDLLIPVFRNGEILKKYTLAEVRKNLHGEGFKG